MADHCLNAYDTRAEAQTDLIELEPARPARTI